MVPVIETHDLSKTYGDFSSLQKLNITVHPGSVFALMGASGAGKTTTIKILLNMLSASAGEARMLGVDTRCIKPKELAGIGYVSENQLMPTGLSVGDFFDYLRPLYPRWDRALEAQLRVDLALPAKRKIGQLSHGMRLKMALACALSYRPKLLILDEPLSGLDALAREEIIGGFLRQAGEMTILISSHELDEVERFATHVAFLHEGKLLFQGSIEALAQHARPLLNESGTGARRTLRDIFIALVRAAKQVPAGVEGARLA